MPGFNHDFIDFPENTNSESSSIAILLVVLDLLLFQFVFSYSVKGIQLVLVLNKWIKVRFSVTVTPTEKFMSRLTESTFWGLRWKFEKSQIEKLYQQQKLCFPFSMYELWHVRVLFTNLWISLRPHAGWSAMVTWGCTKKQNKQNPFITVSYHQIWLHIQEIKFNTGGQQRTTSTITWHDPFSLASWPHAAPREPWGRADGSSCWWVCWNVLTAVVYYSRASPGIQLMANIKAAPGILEQRECGWRSSPMNSASYMGQTPTARCKNAHYQFMEPLNTPVSLQILFFPSL